MLSVQWAGPSQAAGGGGGHRGLDEESRLLGPAASWRRGFVLHQRRWRQRLRPAGGPQLPWATGKLPLYSVGTMSPSSDEKLSLQQVYLQAAVRHWAAQHWGGCTQDVHRYRNTIQPEFLCYVAQCEGALIAGSDYTSTDLATWVRTGVDNNGN